MHNRNEDKDRLFEIFFCDFLIPLHEKVFDFLTIFWILDNTRTFLMNCKQA